MKKVKINFDKLAAYWKPIHPQILFIRPPGCKVFRVCHVSDTHLITGKYKDIVDVLDATATLKRNEMWFYVPGEHCLIEEAVISLMDDLKVEAFMLERVVSDYGRSVYDYPIPEILN